MIFSMCVCFFKGSHGAVFLKLSIGHLHQNPVGHRFPGLHSRTTGSESPGIEPPNLGCSQAPLTQMPGFGQSVGLGRQQTPLISRVPGGAPESLSPFPGPGLRHPLPQPGSSFRCWDDFGTVPGPVGCSSHSRDLPGLRTQFCPEPGGPAPGLKLRHALTS